MNHGQLNHTIQSFTQKSLLEEFHDDYGFTHKTNKDISTIGYSTNLSLETIELAKKNHVDLMLPHHDTWDFLYGFKDSCLQKLKEYQINHFFT
ncbi:Nif3-like dinuclear metal center hexameric protein [Heyndrickxia sporothermodurans]